MEINMDQYNALHSNFLVWDRIHPIMDGEEALQTKGEECAEIDSIPTWTNQQPLHPHVVNPTYL